jgi:hypothetical protein
MFKRVFKFSLRLGALVGIVAIVLKLLEDRESPPPLSTPRPPAAPKVTWVEPTGGVCPASHPVKAKLSSKVFRTPDSPGYEASKPDRCYASEDDAQREGFREAKR